MRVRDFGLIVVGAASAGALAAAFAARLGPRVALVEKGRAGGDCTTDGCLPSKAFLKAPGGAKAAWHRKAGARPGQLAVIAGN
jgi:pyruvate/2-oxoglutarate dehydrogenase complex dihydrolipoamide dehydrogenase (E3) component